MTLMRTPAPGDDGASAVEYALLVVAIAAVVVARGLRPRQS